MSKRPTPSVSQRLSVQILVVIILGVMIVSGARFLEQLGSSRAIIDRDQERISRNIVPVLSYLSWVLNLPQTRQVSRNLLELPTVVGVRVDLEDRNPVVDLRDLSDKALPAGQTETWELRYRRGESSLFLGTLTVTFVDPMSYAFADSLQVWTLIAEVAVLLAVLAVVVVFLRVRVSAPLVQLNRDIDQVDFTRELPRWWKERQDRDRIRETATVREVLTDSARRVRAEIEQKNLLLKEVHHRVKNNLQIVISLFALERDRTATQEARVLLEDSERRIGSMALIHELLYREEHFSQVDMAEYMEELASGMVYSGLSADGRIRITYDLDPSPLDLDQAIPIGLLTTELLTNAVKHAFPDGRGGTIAISTKHEPAGTGRPGPFSLAVCDDGVGLPADWSAQQGGGLGMQIVTSLCDQIGAELQVEAREPGTCFVVRLPMPPS